MIKCQYVSIQVFGSGGSANLTTTIITPKASTQTYSPSLSYDGYSSVTVNGDNNLVPSNIVSRKSIFGVSGSYSPSVILKENRIQSSITMTCYKSYRSSDNAVAWAVKRTIPNYNKKSEYIDLTKMSAIYLYTSSIPKANSSYGNKLVFNSTISEISNNVGSFSNFPYIAIMNGVSDVIYYSMSIVPFPTINISTRELILGLNFNYGASKLDSYITTGTFSVNEIDIFTL